MRFTLKSFVDGLTNVNHPLVSKGRKAARKEVREMFPSAEKVLFDKDRVCVIGKAEVLRYFIECRTTKGKLRAF